jgi:hypothetical protein
MKNLHLIKTAKPSRLHLGKSGLVLCDLVFNPMTINSQHIYITSDEEIKDGDWVLDLHNQIWKLLEGKLIGFDNQGNKRFSTDNIEAHNPKKIILTTDQDLDGVQAIDDEFLEWFVQNPSCESVAVKQELGVCLNCEWNYDSCPNTEECLKDNYKIIIPKEEPKQEYKYIGECNGNNDNGCFLDSPAHGCGCFTRVVKEKPKQETLEEVAHKMLINYGIKSMGQSIGVLGVKKLMVNFAKWQQEQDKNKYSEEEVLDLLYKRDLYLLNRDEEIDLELPEEWFEQFKKK